MLRIFDFGITYVYRNQQFIHKLHIRLLREITDNFMYIKLKL